MSGKRPQHVVKNHAIRIIVIADSVINAIVARAIQAQMLIRMTTNALENMYLIQNFRLDILVLLWSTFYTADAGGYGFKFLNSYQSHRNGIL
jgi:hypothetical protein